MSKKKYRVLLPIFAYGDQWRAGSEVMLEPEWAKEVGLDRLECLEEAPAAPQEEAAPAPAEEKPSAPQEEAASKDAEQPAAPQDGEVEEGGAEDLSDI